MKLRIGLYAKFLGVSISTIYRWIKSGKSFMTWLSLENISKRLNVPETEILTRKAVGVVKQTWSSIGTHQRIYFHFNVNRIEYFLLWCQR
jgi:predicted site-specific integrase-resolvase